MLRDQLNEEDDDMAGGGGGGSGVPRINGGSRNEDDARRESTAGPLRLPKDLQGMDELFLNPLGEYLLFDFS